MIIILIHLKKNLFKGQGGPMETSHHGNASKNRLIKHSAPVKGGGNKSESAQQITISFPWGDMHITNKSYCFN